MTDRTGCTLCELPIEGSDVTDDEGNRFCCVGCRDVFDALGDVDDVAPQDVRRQRADDEERKVPDDHEATYLEVDGVHCAACGAFIGSGAGGGGGGTR
ncbi:cation-transporting P-type ATPase, partial [Natronococcus sp. JC468]|nr:cation-transporting P-type ATPase [Natronococcus sp. JC468]